MCAWSSAVAAPYGVPAASAGDIAAKPLDLIVSGWPLGSAAKLPGAEIVEPVAVQVVASISATKASLKALVRREGYSSERKRRSKERHDELFPAGVANEGAGRVTGPHRVAGGWQRDDLARAGVEGRRVLRRGHEPRGIDRQAN